MERKALPFGHSNRQHNLVSAKILGRETLLLRRRGLNWMWIMLRKQPPSWKLVGTECWSGTKKSRGARLCPASFRRRDYWLASLLLPGCETESNNGRDVQD